VQFLESVEEYIMGLFDRFKKQTEQIQRKEAPKVLINKINAYQSKTNRKYKQFADDGYQQNSIAYRSINLIANNVSATSFKVFSGDQELENHELISLLKRPNPLQSGVEYFHSMVSYLLISGNSYMLKDKEFGSPKELYLLRPDRVEIKAESSMIPSKYCYKIDGKIVNEYPVDNLTGASQLKHIKLWNPLDDFYGLSPIVAGAYNIDQHNLAGLHNVGLLKNGCTPSAMLKFQPKDETGMSATLTDDQRAMILEDLEFRFRGSNNSGRPMLLEGDFDYVQMGLNPKDMDFLELMNASAREIALCFGVPAQLVGLSDTTYANVAEARLSLYEETIIPLLDRIQSDLNEWLTPLYDGDLRIQYDIDSIPAMAEKRKQVFANVSQGVQQGILTRNEARERLGLAPIDGGDSLLVPSNLFPLGEVDDTAPDEDNDMPVDSEGNEKYDDTYELLYGEKEEKLDEYPDGEDVDPKLPSAYRLGTAQKNCGNCIHYENKYCDFFDAEVRAEYLCNAWAGEEEKALSDLDLVPTDSMAREAQKGLDMRKEFGRGGTAVGVARANQLVRKERLSPSTVLRMFSFFSRHEVDKQAEGFNRGEKGFPSAGRIAWQLWGSDTAFSWAKRKRNQIMAEREKSFDDMEIKVAGLSKTVEKALQGKVDEHNDKYGDKKGKRVTVGMLGKVFKRGVGAYRTNPSSVRPGVRSEDQWAYARVNAFLVAVRTGKFRGGKFDLDLLPKDHPLSSKE
jgi:HK97 family phage portal protein